MTEERNKTSVVEETKKKTIAVKANNKQPNDIQNSAGRAVAKSVFGNKARKNRRSPRQKEKDEFDQRILDLARVTRVMAGGKRMRFRACVALGDKKGKVAIGIAKGADVSIAMTKAGNKARKNFIEVPMVNDTIPHEVFNKFGASKLLFKPARRGRGVIAGGVVRVILELSGVKNITSKILGTNNKVSNAKCTIEALKSLKKVEQHENTKQQKHKNIDKKDATDVKKEKK